MKTNGVMVRSSKWFESIHVPENTWSTTQNAEKYKQAIKKQKQLK